MLIFPNGLLNRKHEYILAVEVEVKLPDKEEPDVILNVLNNHNKPLVCYPKNIGFAIENLIKELKDQGVKPVKIHCIDLGPERSALNKSNRKKYADHGFY